MKRNIISGAMLLAVLAFASCSTQKMASTSKVDDDVYYTKAEAGVQPDMPVRTYQQDVYDDTPDDDYYYYDSYASRINRFGYYSPFNYYDDYYYDYSAPTYGTGLGLNTYAYGNYGWGLGLGFGYGYGYNPYYAYSPYGYGLGLGFGYGYGYGYGYPYSVWGIGYGGGYPFWGVYSNYGYYGRSRPFRGSGAPAGAFVNRSARGVGYNGAYPNAGYYPGRSVNGSGRTRTNSYPGGNYGNNGAPSRGMRPARTDYPTYQPPARTTNSTPSYNGGGSSSRASGGGGGRPSRP